MPQKVKTCMLLYSAAGSAAVEVKKCWFLSCRSGMRRRGKAMHPLQLGGSPQSPLYAEMGNVGYGDSLLGKT